MRHSYLAVLSGIILVVLLGLSWCRQKPEAPGLPTSSPVPGQPATPPVAPAATASPTATPAPASPQPPATPLPMQSPSAELKKASAKVGPAVILITTFDSSGKLLRTGPGFFAERDGRLVTALDLVQGAAYAVAKSSDGKIRNVTGVVASSPSADLAVLKAETTIGVPFAALSNTAEPNSTVVLVSSSLERQQQPLAALQITGHETGAGGELLVTSVPPAKETSGAPLVNEKAEVVGIVTMAIENNQPAKAVVRPSDAIASLLGQTQADSPARWLVESNEAPTPTPTPKGKIVYSPSPVYPGRARFARPPLAGSGRFRIVFEPSGQVKDVQIVRSTGQPLLDQAAVEAFRQWKSTPGHEWSMVIPITFRP